MKIYIRDYTGHTTISKVSNKEEFDKIVKEGMKPYQSALVTKDGSTTLFQKEGLKWDSVKDAEEISTLAPLIGG